jgi:hypothetical protein
LTHSVVRTLPVESSSTTRADGPQVDGGGTGIDADGPRVDGGGIEIDGWSGGTGPSSSGDAVAGGMAAAGGGGPKGIPAWLGILQGVLISFLISGGQLNVTYSDSTAPSAP